MLKPDGYAVVLSEDGKIKEIDTYWCAHHGGHTHLRVGETPFATCRSCMGFICESCYNDLARGKICKPLEQMLLEMEAKIDARLTWDRNWRNL